MIITRHHRVRLDKAEVIRVLRGKVGGKFALSPPRGTRNNVVSRKTQKPANRPCDHLSGFHAVKYSTVSPCPKRARSGTRPPSLNGSAASDTINVPDLGLESPIRSGSSWLGIRQVSNRVKRTVKNTVFQNHPLIFCGVVAVLLTVFAVAIIHELVPGLCARVSSDSNSCPYCRLVRMLVVVVLSLLAPRWFPGFQEGPPAPADEPSTQEPRSLFLLRAPPPSRPLVF